MKPGHKYTRRTGAPGHYDYEYPEDLFGGSATIKTKVTDQVVPVTAIHRDPTQPREHFDEGKLKELAASIKKIGLVQPIAIRPHPEIEGEFMVIAGERRWRAMQMAGIETVKTQIYHTTNAKEIAELQVAENVGRAQMNPMEEATAYQKMINTGATIDEIAEAVGTSQVTVERRIAFLSLIPQIQEMVRHGSLVISRAEIIAGAYLKPEYQKNIIKRLNMGKVSREALRGMVGRYQTAQTQTTLFTSEGNTIDQRITKQRRNSLERDLGKLLDEFGGLLERVGEGGGAKIIPALVKEKGKLAVTARKVAMINEEMKKLDREMQFALKYFEGGGTIDGYLNAKGIKGKRRRRKARKSLVSTLEKGKKFEVGHISTHRDGSRWLKVSRTGDPAKDWRQAKATTGRKQQAKQALLPRNPKYQTKAWQEKYINDYLAIVTRPIHTPGMKKRIKKMEELFRTRTGKNIKKYTQKVEGILSQQAMKVPKAKVDQAAKNYLDLDVHSPEFKKWFGDWESKSEAASKVVDPKRRPQKNHASEVNLEGSKPKVMYHGTHYGGFRAFDKNTLLPGLFGRGFYFTENKEVAESYNEKGTNFEILGTMYDTIYMVQDPENRKKINAYAAERLPVAEKKLVEVLKMIKEVEAGINPREVSDKYGHGWALATRGGMTARRAALKKRVAGLKAVPNMTDVELNQLIDQSKYKHKAHLPHDNEFYKLVSQNIPKLEPMTYSLYLNIRNPLDMDRRMPKALIAEFKRDPDIKKMIKMTKKAHRGRAQMAGMQVDEKKYAKALRKVWGASTYLNFYIRIRQMMAQPTTIFGGMDENLNNDLIIQRMLKDGKHDGITHIGGDAINSEIKHRVWITLEPTQVKAVENRGTFNPKDPDLYKGLKVLMPTKIKLPKSRTICFK